MPQVRISPKDDQAEALPESFRRQSHRPRQDQRRPPRRFPALHPSETASPSPLPPSSQRPASESPPQSGAPDLSSRPSDATPSSYSRCPPAAGPSAIRNTATSSHQKCSSPCHTSPAEPPPGDVD